jgi:hypothetical protein
MVSLIDYSQTTYINGCYIMDNVDCAHEVLHQVKLSKTKSVLFKIDFKKSFDRVNYNILIETLIGKDFGHKWIN